MPVDKKSWFITMSRRSRFIAYLLAVLCAVPLAYAAEPVSPPSGEVAVFEKEIRPLLVQYCYECHSAGRKVQGGLRLDHSAGWLTGGDSGPALQPGQPDESLLIQAVRYGKDGPQMPPQGKLADDKIRRLENWVRSGAKAPEETAVATVRRGVDVAKGRSFWSYQPLRNSTVPANEAGTTIDRFLNHRLREAKIVPNGVAERASLIRRLTFDLSGLPPTETEIADFCQEPRADAYEQLVDRLLASPHFGERWGRHWLDVARFAESLTLRGFLLENAWRYRDYVIESFNRDLPYDQFLREQLAGDLLPSDDLEQRRRQLIATAFLALGNTNLEEQDKQQLDLDFVDEQLETIGRGLLGQTLGCARCHDHKFDPIPTRDYYALAGILRNTQPLIHDNVSKWIDVPLPLEAESERDFTAAEEQLKEVEKRFTERQKQLTKLTAKPAGTGDVVQASELPGVAVDDPQAKQIGSWTHSQFTKRYIGSGYLHDDNRDKGNKTLTFAPQLPADGRYEVRFAYSHDMSRAANVPLTIMSADGETNLTVDERVAPPIDGRFVSLGTFTFERSGQSFVLVSTTGTTGFVTADAVLFIPAKAVANDPPQSPNPSVDSAPHRPPPPPPSAEALDNNSSLVLELRREQKQDEAERERLKKIAATRPKSHAILERKEIRDWPIQNRGLVGSPGEAVPRGFLQVTLPPNAKVRLGTDQSGRRELADWVSSPENPLTSRVMANRLWHWLMGQGLVRTPDNFGATGETPSHPELLDYLAGQFLRQGWSVKRLIREIVLSAAYQRSTKENASGFAHDPENLLCWRMNRSRLDAECLRDAVLVVAGHLDRQMGGATFPATLKADFGYRDGGTRRSVYLPLFRNALPPIFEAFDFPDPNVPVGRRNVSNVVPQALFLLNDPWLRQQAAISAARLLSETANDPDSARLEIAFRRVLSRAPTGSESQLALSYLGHAPPGTTATARWTDLFHGLFASLDFRYRD